MYIYYIINRHGSWRCKHAVMSSAYDPSKDECIDKHESIFMVPGTVDPLED